ncbi:MAG TPA: methionine--tRNA ligase [bacterium]|nr:methionine--tRNA ligase [bacterium]HPQ18714.1 methionine--tRNA ligase [bacterium]
MKKERKKILVTSALPYANGPIHIGHIAGAYLPADIFVRFCKMKKRDVVYICGTDEHGVPITITAEKENVTPQQIVDKYHKIIKEAFLKLGIEFDNFSRTSLEIHHKTSQDFFLKIYEKGYLKEKTITQFYCEKCKRFLADRYVEGICPYCKKEGARGDQCENCGKWLNPEVLIEPKCKVCGSTPVLKETKHLFLKMDIFQKQIEEYICSKKYWKENVTNYCNGWFKEGLTERAVTRDINWGIKVPIPGYEDKVIYVWFEAPIGYISSTKEWARKKGKPDLWKEYWQNPECELIHFIGKDNIVFHAVVWPITLLAYGGYNLPTDIPANEFLNISSKKISTSRNWAIWVHEFLEEFSADSLRYTLAINAPETRDTDFTWEDFQLRNNSELADVIGNFVNRTLVFIKKYFNGKIPEKYEFSARDKEILNEIKLTKEQMTEYFERYCIKDATQTFFKLAKSANKYFNDSEPWRTLKENINQCKTTIYVCAQLVKALALLMNPIMPFAAQKIWKMLKYEGKIQDQNWDDIDKNFIEENKEIGEIKIIFNKIEDKQIEKQIQKLTGDIPKQDEKQETENIITIDDFKKIKLKTAKILEAENVKNSNKLIRLQIKIGEEKRQIIAGIAEYYKPEDLIGKTIVVVTNLQKAKLFGLESNGMLLAAKKNGKLTLLTVENNEISDGADIS